MASESNREPTRKADGFLFGKTPRWTGIGAIERLRADDGSVFCPASLCPHGYPNKKRRYREPAGPRSLRANDSFMDCQCPGGVCAFETNTPDISDRIEAMRRCAQMGYPVRAVIMPIIPVADWREVYRRFMASLMASVPLSRITLGFHLLLPPSPAADGTKTRQK